MFLATWTPTSKRTVRILVPLAKRSLAYFEGGKLADGTIFRRPLPAPAIELSSAKGTTLFAEALQDGTAKCFFRLMEQLHTQNEPEYCGLATLVTVLNALNIDPHRRWKGNWRFYSEELLDCCEPLTKVKKAGIDFDKLASLARCNGLKVDAVRASDTSLEAFRSIVLEASRTEDYTLALAYSRKVLNQTGSGHYSPMGAYHAKSDHLLILDCARFKYRPHWVPVPLMFEAMKVIDPDTNKTRGFMKMSAVYQHGPPPAAHVLTLTTYPKTPFELKELQANLSRVAASAVDAQEFLSRTTDLLESILKVELKGHGCSSTSRRARITEQLGLIKNWDESFSAERASERKAVMLSLDHAYLAELLHNRHDLKDQVMQWIKLPDNAGELAVELSFTRPKIQEMLDAAREDEKKEYEDDGGQVVDKVLAEDSPIMSSPLLQPLARSKPLVQVHQRSQA